MTIPDPDQPGDEDRFVLMGLSIAGRLLVVVHVERGDTIRLISARVAQLSERKVYEEG